MSKVIFDTSMSLDGFMTAANVRPEEPLGDGGEQLHWWAFGQDEVSRKLMEEESEKLGAVICGRTTYDHSIQWWGADGPTGPLRRPVFVVTHSAPATSPNNGVYSFVIGGIAQALEAARKAAGSKNISVMGGADIGQQYIRAGLVDEISIHLAPVLFGSGTRMFEHLGNEHIQLEAVGAIQTVTTTHLRFRVVK